MSRNMCRENRPDTQTGYGILQLPQSQDVFSCFSPRCWCSSMESFDNKWKALEAHQPKGNISLPKPRWLRVCWNSHTPQEKQTTTRNTSLTIFARSQEVTKTGVHKVVFGAGQTAQCIPKAAPNRYFLYGMCTTPTYFERFLCDRGGVAPVTEHSPDGGVYMCTTCGATASNKLIKLRQPFARPTTHGTYNLKAYARGWSPKCFPAWP